MYQSILVALDGSEFSASALPTAAALARRTGGRLNLVVVFDPSTMLHFAPGEATIPVFDVSVADKRCAELRGWVEEQAASISNTGVPASGAMLEGTVVEALAEHAIATNAELVIMTTHGRGGFDRLRLGSVASSFLGRSPVPVFLVRPTGSDAPTPGHELPTGTLLVTLDGSKFAESMLPHASRFANALGMDVELVRVAEPGSTPLALFGADALVVEDFVTLDEEAEAFQYLKEQASHLTVSKTAKVKVLAETSSSRAIVNYARESDAGAIALATHGRSGLVRIILGSVADKVLRGAEQPMLVYRPSDDATPASGTSESTGASLPTETGRSK
ncbi:MAG: universal stress protein [Gemmatimonadaceae bacterium]